MCKIVREVNEICATRRYYNYVLFEKESSDSFPAFVFSSL